MSRGMNTELMRRLWIKLNCWPETVSLQKNKKKRKKNHPFYVYSPLHDHQYEWKWKEAQCKKCDEWFVALLPPAPLSADQLLRKTRPIVEIKQLQCIACVTKLRPLLKANYIIVMYRAASGQNAPIVWVMQLNSIQRKLMKTLCVDFTAPEYINIYSNQLSLCCRYRPQHQL